MSLRLKSRYLQQSFEITILEILLEVILERAF
jgi:hypothetical protein